MHLTRNYANKALKAKENRDKFLSRGLEEKRGTYACRDKYVTLDKIPTWPDYYRKAKLDMKKSRTLFLRK